MLEFRVTVLPVIFSFWVCLGFGVSAGFVAFTLVTFGPRLRRGWCEKISRGLLGPSRFGFRGFGVPMKRKTNGETP